MWGVVNEGGTGAAAHIQGIELAGKTGSAQRISNTLAKANRALAQELKDNGWFVGFAPADHPKLLVSVMVDEPQGGSISGGQVAAPAFQKIAQFALPYLRIPPS